MKFNHPNSPFALSPPADLRDWLEEIDILNAVLEAVQTPDGLQPDPESGAIPAGAPRTIGALLVYSLAVGVCASNGIVACLASDPTTRYLSAGLRPEAHDLRRFRLEHRRALEIALANVLRTAWEFRLWSIISEASDCDSAAACGSVFSETSGRNDHDLAAYFKGKAAKRLHQAEALDRLVTGY